LLFNYFGQGALLLGHPELKVKEAFEAFGAVQSAAIIKDKFSGDSRGFGGSRGRY